MISKFQQIYKNIHFSFFFLFLLLTIFPIFFFALSLSLSLSCSLSIYIFMFFFLNFWRYIEDIFAFLLLNTYVYFLRKRIFSYITISVVTREYRTTNVPHTFLKECITAGVPWWHNRLRILYCHCSGVCHYCGMGSIPGLGTFTCCRLGWKKKAYITANKTKQNNPFAKSPDTCIICMLYIQHNVGNCCKR